MPSAAPNLDLQRRPAMPIIAEPFQGTPAIDTSKFAIPILDDTFGKIVGALETGTGAAVGALGGALGGAAKTFSGMGAETLAAVAALGGSLLYTSVGGQLSQREAPQENHAPVVETSMEELGRMSVMAPMVASFAQRQKQLFGLA